jgi:hypothetical protein
MRQWVLVGCLAWIVAVPLANGCGDDEGDEGPEGEKCFQAGGLDDGCRCSAEQPTGMRRCQDNLIWSACVCPEPYDPPCVRGEIVECTCPGDDEVHTTECLGSGTFDCDCESGGASGNGD